MRNLKVFPAITVRNKLINYLEELDITRNRNIIHFFGQEEKIIKENI